MGQVGELSELLRLDRRVSGEDGRGQSADRSMSLDVEMTSGRRSGGRLSKARAVVSNGRPQEMRMRRTKGVCPG